MNDNIIEVGDFRIARKGRIDQYDRQKCRHMHVELNDHGETVTCSDCGVQVSAYWALHMVADYWKDHARAHKSAVARLEEDKKANLHLIAARKVEGAWRDRKMVPCCPHCGEGISPADGLGATMISKRIDDARRESRSKSKGTSQ